MEKSTLHLFALLVFVSTFICWTKAGILRVEEESYCELQFKPCSDVKNPVGKLDKAVFNGTCNGPVAILKKGTFVMINFTFESNIDETSLKSHVCGQLGSIPYCVPFPLAKSDACKDSGLKCPVKAHHAVSFDALLEVKSMYPSVNVFVKWELKDQNDKDVFCGVIPATISA